MLCAVMAVMLWSYANETQEIFDELGKDGKMNNLLWLVKHISYILPVIVGAVALTALYSAAKWNQPAISKLEQGIAVLITMLFTYAVMLPYVISKTPEAPLPQEIIDKLEKIPPSLIEITRGWFFVQIIPFILWALYLFVRCESEKRELSEESEEQ